MAPRQLDVEFQKHILDTNPMQLAFNCAFAGWRLVTRESIKEIYGKKKKHKEPSYVVDYAARVMNESGSSVLLNEVMPLINPATATSHLKPMDIYNLWHGHITTIELLIRDSYFYPSYRCLNKGCHVITPDERLIEEHLSIYGHAKYEEVLNPFEFDISRAPNIITTLLGLSAITGKAKEGFTLRELAESFMTQQTIQSGQAMQQQPVGIMRRLLGRGGQK
jgi:hypothetical protein